MEALKIQKVGFSFDDKALCVFVLLLSCFTLRVYGYGGSEHTDITQKAIANYQTWVAANPINRVGANAVANYSGWIVDGAVNEDYPIYEMPWLEHYMDQDTGEGLWGHPSAFVRATSHWFNARDEYKSGDYPMAYHWLGRVIHLAEDMGVPAHTLLDPHWHLIWPIEDPDWYEVTYIPGHHLEETDTSNLNSVMTLEDIMYGLADGSDDFDSDDYDGETTAVDRSDGFDDTEGAIIANSCYKGQSGRQARYCGSSTIP